MLYPHEHPEASLSILEMTTPEDHNNHTDDLQKSKHYDLLVKEYDVASVRYENIYKAIWQNFSYMGILSAGILTFGNGSKLPLFVIIIIASLPLIFWYFATYAPMDYYGKCTALRLGEIEDTLNKSFLTDNENGMKLYRNFIDSYTHNQDEAENKNLLKKPWRVSSVVTRSGIIFLSISVIGTVYSFLIFCGIKLPIDQPKTPSIQLKSSEPLNVKIDGPDFLNSKRKMDVLETKIDKIIESQNGSKTKSPLPKENKTSLNKNQ